MSSKTNSKKNKLEKYREMLLDERQSLLEELNSDKNMYTDLDNYKEGDLADRAYSNYEMGFLAKLSDQQRYILDQINKAYCIAHADHAPDSSKKE